MTDINYALASGEIILKKQDYDLNQGIGNQSDGTLYLTNQQLIFNIKQGGLDRGLDFKIPGQKDAKVEFIFIPLEFVRGVEKKYLKIKTHRLHSHRNSTSGSAQTPYLLLPFYEYLHVF